mgnify:CR=1 FL=1
MYPKINDDASSASEGVISARPGGSASGSVIGGFDSIYVVTCEDGHWGVKARSSYAP